MMEGVMMKKRVIATIITAGTALMLSGCGESAIECDDINAQKAVIEISENEVKNLIGRMSSDLTMRQAFSLYTYQMLPVVAKQYPAVADYIKKIDNMYREAAPTLINIRTVAMDDNLKKSECAAEIGLSDGSKIPITYTLSKTSEGKLYTEVFGF